MKLRQYFFHVDEETGREYRFDTKPTARDAPLVSVVYDNNDGFEIFISEAGIFPHITEMEYLMPVPRGVGWKKIGSHNTGWAHMTPWDVAVYQRRRPRYANEQEN